MGKYLQTINKNKREEWKLHYAYSSHPENDVKNYLINQSNRICPGFKYLIDFEWEVGMSCMDYRSCMDRGSGDLIFGSDYGVYLVIETKALRTWSVRNSQISRHNSKHKAKEAKEKAKKYRELANKRFDQGAKVIGATFTDEDYRIRFLDDDGVKLAKFVANGGHKFMFLVLSDRIASLLYAKFMFDIAPIYFLTVVILMMLFRKYLRYLGEPKFYIFYLVASCIPFAIIFYAKFMFPIYFLTVVIIIRRYLGRLVEPKIYIFYLVALCIPLVTIYMIGQTVLYVVGS